MARDYAQEPRNKLRRSDRGVADETWIKELLTRTAVGSLATVHEGQPFINTNLFVYDEPTQAIYLHTAQVGRTRANIEANPQACFSVSEMGRLLPAWEAVEMSTEYNSVVIFGTMTIIKDYDECRRVLQLMLDKYFAHLTPGEDYREIQDDEIKRTAVYKLAVEDWSGKQKSVAPDFPGAFFYGHPPEDK